MARHPLDIALQGACPTVMVPLYGDSAPLTSPGHRFLSASVGLWIEINRPWMKLVWPIATQTDFPTPYCELEKKIDLAFGKVSTDLINQFISDAEIAFPNEFDAWLVWNDQAKQLRYHAMQTIAAGPGRLKAKSPDLAEHESLAVNLHSHGIYPAYFSSEDHFDDRDEVKIAGVFGSFVGKPLTSAYRNYTTAFRICAGGESISLGSKISVTISRGA